MVTKGGYVPGRGDIVWLEFSPQPGHEQAGKRPALVLSPATYNAKTGLFIACPVTSQVKGYPFEVQFPERVKIDGVALSDQLKSLDWRARKARFACKAPKPVVSEALAKIATLLT